MTRFNLHRTHLATLAAGLAFATTGGAGNLDAGPRDTIRVEQSGRQASAAGVAQFAALHVDHVGLASHQKRRCAFRSGPRNTVPRCR